MRHELLLARTGQLIVRPQELQKPVSLDNPLVSAVTTTAQFPRYSASRTTLMVFYQCVRRASECRLMDMDRWANRRDNDYVAQEPLETAPVGLLFNVNGYLHEIIKDRVEAHSPKAVDFDSPGAP